MWTILAGFVANKWLWIIGSTSALVIGIWLYVSHLQSKVQVLEANNAKLEQAIAIEKQAVEQVKADVSAMHQSYTEYSNKVREVATSVESLNKTLYREQRGKKSLAELAAKKPGLIEKIINDGTHTVKRCLEILTGSNATDEEKKLCAN